MSSDEQAKEKAREKRLEDYRLLGEDAGSIPELRRPWCRLGLYRSPICVVVHVEPRPRPQRWQREDQEAAKAALYRYLREVNQTLLDFGIMQPISCVVRTDNTEIGTTIQLWTSDQSWHRGGFTVYLDCSEKDSFDLLFGLLAPEVNEIIADPDRQARDINYFIKELRGAKSGASQEQFLTENLLDKCIAILEAYKPNTGEDSRQDGRFLPILDWENEQKQAAQALVRQEG